jgi:glycosyltransferase involved in cell wall biosynthesis
VRQKLRVLVVGVSRFSMPTGICRYTDVLCRSLSSIDGVDVTIAVGIWQQDYFRQVFKTHTHSEIVAIDIRNNALSRNAWYTLKLPQICRSLDVDIVHFAYPVPFLRPLCCPTVVTVHDLYPFEIPTNFRFATANRMFLRYCVRRCDAIICVSQTTLKTLTNVVPDVATNRILAQIYTPVEIPETIVDQQPVLNLRPLHFLLTVGQHRHNKNIDILQRTFARLRVTGQVPSDWKLVIVGSEGPKTAELRALTRELGLSEQVIYLSSIAEPELAWLYQNAAVAAFPSSHEGFCLPVAESLSSGLRVVCSNIPTLREIGRDGCTYFELESQPVEALASAIAKAISGPAPAPSAGHRFRSEGAASELMQVYQSLV